MDAQARDTGFRSLEYDNFPEISEANILSTCKQLHHNKDELFERGEINAFRGPVSYTHLDVYKRQS